MRERRRATGSVDVLARVNAGPQTELRGYLV